MSDKDKLIKDFNHLNKNLKEAIEEGFYYSASDYIKRIIVIKKELEEQGVFL